MAVLDVDTKKTTRLLILNINGALENTQAQPLAGKGLFGNVRVKHKILKLEMYRYSDQIYQIGYQ